MKARVTVRLDYDGPQAQLPAALLRALLAASAVRGFEGISAAGVFLGVEEQEGRVLTLDARPEGPNFRVRLHGTRDDNQGRPA